jgi:hypothetical protein
VLAGVASYESAERELRSLLLVGQGPVAPRNGCLHAGEFFLRDQWRVLSNVLLAIPWIDQNALVVGIRE